MTGKWIGFNYGLKVQTETKLKSSGKLNFVPGPAAMARGHVSSQTNQLSWADV